MPYARTTHDSLLATNDITPCWMPQICRYRDSKLTQLLRNCLGGNARTAESRLERDGGPEALRKWLGELLWQVLITVSPHKDNAGESLSSLRFGARASLVENAATENVAENAWSPGVERSKALVEEFGRGSRAEAPAGARSPGPTAQMAQLW